MTSLLRIAAAGILPAIPGWALQPGPAFGSETGVGTLPLAGHMEFDAAKGEYKITGGGANMWGQTDAFHFVWRRVSGDLTLTADVQFVGKGVNGHRKAALLVRQSLDADSAYADIALHGDGLTSLQYRAEKGGITRETRSPLNGPLRIRLERRGNTFTAYAGKPGEELTQAGPATVVLQDPVYVGLGVCSHDASLVETAAFTNVSLQTRGPRYRGKLSIFDIRDKSARVIYTADEMFEAPNWSRDGKFLLINSGGGLFKVPVEGGTPERLALDPTYRCNNDHDFSRDGKWLAISASTPASRRSQVFLTAADGSNPRLLTPASPSYFHGWSPDGRWLSFVGLREGNFDLFRAPFAGGEEQRLTSHKAYDDGPDYSPDGKWIYFNSNRSGGWDIWRIPAEGAGPGDERAQRVTGDAQEDWFPHPSPDGKWLVFLSFPPGTEGHDGKMEIQLRMMNLPGRKVKADARIETLKSFFGGQGTINVNSWAPDSRRFAFAAYEVLPDSR